jgi:hypothetical protein
VPKLIAVLAVAAVAFAAAGQAAAKTRIVATPIVKKYPLPKLNVGTHPRIPKICVNELSKGPGAKKCG